MSIFSPPTIAYSTPFNPLVPAFAQGVPYEVLDQGYTQSFGPEQGMVVELAQLHGSRGRPSRDEVVAFTIGMLGDVVPLASGTRQVVSVTTTDEGSGYTSAPTVAFSGGGGTGAAGTAIISPTGTVIAVELSDTGTGYTSAPTVAFSGGGGTGATATTSVGGFSRKLPAQHSRFPWLWCQSCDLVKPDGVTYYGIDNAVLNQQMVFRCTYANRGYPVLSDAAVSGNELNRFVEVVPDYSHEAYTTGPPAFQWGSGSLLGKPILEPSSIVMPLTNLSLNWKMVPFSSNFENVVAGLEGTINIDALVTPVGTYEARTLLFMSAKKSAMFYNTASGTRVVDLAYQIIHRPMGWDKLFCRKDAAFQFAEVASGPRAGQPPYIEQDFYDLFAWIP
jgi:hypothetical protein